MNKKFVYQVGNNKKVLIMQLYSASKKHKNSADSDVTSVKKTESKM